MPKAKDWTFEKRLLRKPSMWRQKHCYSYSQVSERLTPNISKDIDRQRGKQTPEKISLPTLSLPTYLVGNNHLLLTRFSPSIWKRTKTTTEIFDVDKDRDKANTHLQRMSISLPKRKKETFLKSSAFTIGGKAIMPTNILKRGKKSQKTSDGHSYLYADNCS